MAELQHQYSDIAQDLGVLVAINQPPHVSWLDFGCLALTDYGLHKPEVGHSYLGTVPVPTRELLTRKGTPLETGDMFWTGVNLGATSQADVFPGAEEDSYKYDIEFCKPNPDDVIQSIVRIIHEGELNNGKDI